jgi:hypothetical protein
VEVHPGDDYEPRTGTATKRSFERMSRRTRCPKCGGYNVAYHQSYVAHVASLVRRHDAHPSEVWFLTVTLDRQAADRAAADGWSDSYQVLTGDGGALTRALRRLRRRAPQLVYVGVIAARPSDGRAHAHLVLICRLPRMAIEAAAHVAGLDVEVRSPGPTDSADDFAACCADYAFANHASSPSARFTSSNRGGAGYDSAVAKDRRREAVEQDRRAREGSEETYDDGTAAGATETPETEWMKAADDGTEATSTTQAAKRAPPVECGGEVYDDADGYVQAVRRALMARVGTAVHVVGVGTGTLLRVDRHPEDDTGLICEVHLDDLDETVETRWREVRADNVPRIRVTRQQPRRAMSSPTGADDDTDDGADDVVARFNEAARYSRVTFVRDDGRREVTVKDHVTGEVERKTLPPRR